METFLVILTLIGVYIIIPLIIIFLVTVVIRTGWNITSKKK